ncbi:MAG: hypothetical protein ACRDDZ_07865 [Marinifilaceae bacterium]
MKLKHILYTGILGAGMMCCSVPQEGFFSHEGIKMREDTVEVIRGLFQMSAIPEVDGSTRPIIFDIAAFRDLKTGQEEAINTYEINTWTEAFHPDQDSTMDLVSKKLLKKQVAPFEVNPYSGQIIFNGATQRLPKTYYSLDVRATNVNDSKVFRDFCKFKLISKSFETATDFGDMINGIPATGEKDRVGLQPSSASTYSTVEKEQVLNNTNPKRRLTKIEDGDMLKVIMVVRDAEGKPFKGDDIIFWPSGASYLNNYHDNSIAESGAFDKVIKNDTACIFNFPTVPWPSFGRQYADGTNLYLAYYCVRWESCTFSPAGQELLDAHNAKPGAQQFVTFSPRFRNGYKINETGTWLMEITHPFILRK